MASGVNQWNRQVPPSRRLQVLRPRAKKGKGLTKKQTAQITRKITNFYKKTTERHLKHTDLATGVGTTGVYLNLSSISQGDTYLTRTGANIVCENLVIRFRFAPNASAAQNTLRLIVFQWNHDNTLDVPADTQVFEEIGTAEKVHLSAYKHDSRFMKVLYDKLYQPVVPTSSALCHTFTVPVKGKVVKYASGLSTGRDHIYMVVIANDGTNTGDFDGFAALTFFDA